VATPTLALAAQPATSKLSTGREWRVLRAFVRHRLAVSGLLVFLLLAFAAIFAPLVATHDPYTVDLLAAGSPPSREHWLGTDEVGRDVFSRLVFGSRVSLSVGLVAVTIYTLLGTFLGAISGYFGGSVDAVIQRL
jgi:peptide/nickel transport system permease protein